MELSNKTFKSVRVFYILCIISLCISILLAFMSQGDPNWLLTAGVFYMLTSYNKPMRKRHLGIFFIAFFALAIISFVLKLLIAQALPAEQVSGQYPLTELLRFTSSLFSSLPFLLFGIYLLRPFPNTGAIRGLSIAILVIQCIASLFLLTQVPSIFTFIPLFPTIVLLLIVYFSSNPNDLNFFATFIEQCPRTALSHTDKEH